MPYKIGELTLSISASVPVTVSGTPYSNPPTHVGAISSGYYGQGSCDWAVQLDQYAVSGHLECTGYPSTADLTVGSYYAELVVGGNGYSIGPIKGQSSYSSTGEANIQIPCDICWEYAPLDGNTTGYFNNILDSPPGRKLVFMLIARDVVTVTGSFAGMSGSYTNDERGVVVAAGLNFVCSGGCQGTAVANGALGTTPGVGNGNVTCSMAITTNINPGSVPSLGVSDSGTQTFPSVPPGGASLTQSQSASATLTATSAGFTLQNASASASMGYSAQRQFDIQGVIRAMEAAYPDTVHITCSGYAIDPSPPISATSGWGKSGTQQAYTASLSCVANSSGTPQTAFESVSQFQDIKALMSSADLDANHDDDNLRRVILHGQQTYGMTLAQAASTTIDPMTDGATGTGAAGDPVVTMSTTSTGTGAAASVAGGNLTIVAGSSAPASVTRTYAPALNLGAAAYLRVPITGASGGPDNIPLTITVGGWTWNVTTGTAGTLTNCDLRLDCPNSPAPSSDSLDSHWNETNTGITTPGAGVTTCASISINGIPAGATVTVGELSLITKFTQSVDAVPTLYDGNVTADLDMSPMWPTQYKAPTESDSADHTFYFRRGICVNSDGRQMLEEWDLSYTYVEGSSGTDYIVPDDRSIDALSTQINTGSDNNGARRWRGFTTTEDLPAPTAFVFDPAYDANAHETGFVGQPVPADPYAYNATAMLASEIMGGGCLCSPPSGSGGSMSWSYGWDVAMPGGSCHLPSQMLFDVITLTGMEGDPFGLGGDTVGGSGKVATFGASTVFRSGAHGRVMMPSGVAELGAGVQLNQSGAVVSTGVSRANDGWFAMRTDPFAKTPAGPGNVTPAGSSSPSVTLSGCYSRHRHRAILIASACPTLFLGDPLSYFPFTPQFSDPNVLPTEEWRRIKAAADPGSNNAAESDEAD